MAITLEEARQNIGRSVIYRRPGYVGTAPAEEGTIQRVGASLVFVLYRGDLRSKGTYPDDLEWSNA